MTENYFNYSFKNHSEYYTDIVKSIKDSVYLIMLTFMYTTEFTFIVKLDELAIARGTLNLADCVFELVEELDEMMEGGALLRMVAVVGDPPVTVEFEHPILCFS